jgi:hypothetical protein
MVNDFLDKYLMVPTFNTYKTSTIINLQPVTKFKRTPFIKSNNVQRTTFTQKTHQKKVYSAKNMNHILNEEYHAIWKHHKRPNRHVNYPKIVSIYGIMTDICEYHQTHGL